MSKLGGYLAVFGIVSIILSFTNYYLKIFFWIENWGPTVAWAIRIGFVIVGAALFFMGGSNSDEDEPEVQQPE